MKRIVLAALLASTTAAMAGAEDFGAMVDAMLAENAAKFFGIGVPLAASAAESVAEGYRLPDATALDQVDLAGGLSAAFVTRNGAQDFDMMTFYPAENPSHLVACIEGDRAEIAPGKMNPGVQTISLADGAVTTIVRGTNWCDGIRTTAWGTVFFTEEDDLGLGYEILNPLAITAAVDVKDRVTGETSDAAAVRRWAALPTMAWEGIGILPDGTLYAGDELRPGTDIAGADGGAIFKFVPATPASGMITSLDASPFAAGKTYAMQVQCLHDTVQFGQGCETGTATWIEVDPARPRADANEKGATGYYRPEDLHIDPVYAGEGVRFCWADTGREAAQNYGEVMCAIDQPASIPLVDAEGKIAMTTVVTRFIAGDAQANSFDNLEFQPGTGILYVIEDHDNGDVWACLPDGADRDVMTDGCLRALSVKDSSAEPTGFIFDATGKTAYVAIQHSDDAGMALVDDYGTDDLLVITGFGEVAK